MSEQSNLDDKARTIREVANNFGWTSDIPTLIERVKQMDKGLVQEDEFIYLLNWSDKCSLIHKLDQLPIPPTSKNEYNIPDLFVIFNDNGIKSSFFIEIKTSKDNKLSWTEKYYQGLVNYSKATGIPILIAWKWQSFGIWSLFELRHFEKSVSNYKIGFEKAHMENLMSKMAGDYFIVPSDELSIHFKFKKEKKITEENNETLWDTVCESIYITGNEGKEISDFDSGIFAYLFSIPMEESFSETETHFINSFTPSPDKSTFAQTIPIRLTKAFSNGDVNWLEKIKSQEFPIKHEVLFNSLAENIKKGIINYICLLKPKSDE